MMRRFIFLAAAFLASAIAGAAITYPINVDDWKGRTAYLDVDSGVITDRGKAWPATDPDAFNCPVCGINPGWSASIAPLRMLDVPVLPDYDSNLYSLRLLEVICGPDAGTLDARCEGQTDVLKRVWEVIDRTQAERVQAAANEASYQVGLNIPSNKLLLYLLIQVGLNAYRLDSQQLPAKWQAFNDKNLSYIQTKILPLYDRYRQLKGKVEDGSIAGGDMDTGWPVPVPADLPE